jgi:hypothetical protein
VNPSDAVLEVAAFQARPAEQQDPSQLRKLVLGAAGAAAAAAAPAPAVTAVPSASARGAASATILGALVGFLAKKRALDEQQLTAVLVSRAHSTGEPNADLTSLLALEAERAEQFGKKQEARLRATLPQILAMPEGEARADAMRALMERESRYEEQRSAAMFGRALGGLNATVLKNQSPQGAYWKLSPFVKEHTVGCLKMGERFWPWSILDKLHPPRHPGCPCHLEGYMAAVSNGWMKPGDVPTEAQAQASSQGVVMEALEGQEFALEQRIGPLREALAAHGMVDVLEFDRLAGVC